MGTLIKSKGKTILTMVLVFVAVIAMIFITKHYENDIQVKYDGMKYQAGNPDTYSSQKIEMNGVLIRNGLFGDKIFRGKIVVGGLDCRSASGDDIYGFSKENMSFIKNEKFEGFIFIGGLIDEITITIDKEYGTETGLFSFKNGWLISAPCKQRIEAIKISNKLIHRLHKDIIIK